MLYFIGLGLGDAEDITVRGLKIVKSAKEVYLEAYTSVLTIGKEALVCLLFFYAIILIQPIITFVIFYFQEEYYGRGVIIADREFVEQKSDEMIELAKNNDVAFLGKFFHSC